MSLKTFKERKAILDETRFYNKYYDEPGWVQCQLFDAPKGCMCSHEYCIMVSQRNEKEPQVDNKPSQRSLENSVKYLLEKEYSRKKNPANKKERFEPF